MKDAVELFTAPYMASPVWMLVARLDRIKETAAILEMLNSDFPELENQHDLRENQTWCMEHINTFDQAIALKENVDHDTSRFATYVTNKSIPKFTDDEEYEIKIHNIRADYLKDLEDGMSSRQAEQKKISAEALALNNYKSPAAADTRD